MNGQGVRHHRAAVQPSFINGIDLPVDGGVVAALRTVRGQP
jgi:hypothetical protein